MKFNRLSFAWCAVSVAFAQAAPPVPAPAIPLRIGKVLNSISAGELKGDLSFLASDALAGRYTPSPGLAVAAEFIASKFRAAGLEPGGDHDYFQVAEMVDRHLPKVQSGLKLDTGAQAIEVARASVEVYQATGAANIVHVPLVVFSSADTDLLNKTDVSGKAVMHEQPDFSKMSHEKAIAEYHRMRAFGHAVGLAGAAIEIIVRHSEGGVPEAKLISAAEASQHQTPILTVTNEAVSKWLAQETSGSGGHAFITVDIPAPDDRRVALNNVVGILRGSDPHFKSTCVLLTAHYDHIGTIETATGMASPPKKETTDRIYNGANDDGSGTVSVIEIARALAQLNVHPKRSVVFMTFFGEERGELGSQFYGEHPVFPIAQTVADVNLEQVGRTDSTVGKQVNTASLTGYDYSDVTKYLEKAGLLTGIKVYKDPQASDAYFTQSDNSPLAEQGVPAHSLTVAFDYPDYHGLGDEWQKIDYDNMARVDRMIALAVLNIANDPKAPAWNAQNSKTAPFRKARESQASK